MPLQQQVVYSHCFEQSRKIYSERTVTAPTKAERPTNKLVTALPAPESGNLELVVEGLGRPRPSDEEGP